MTNDILRRVLLVAGGTAVVLAPAASQTPADLVAVMEKYAAALRADDVEGLAGLYSANGVFMRENMPAVVGTAGLRAAYKEVFATLRADLRFTIQETEVAGDMAWLRSTSAGRIKVLATGAETDESFNQLVVFRKEASAWKIRSYLYASDRGGPQVSR